MSKPDAVREALAELVALKDLKDRLTELHEMGHGTDYGDYHKRHSLAWAAARAALSAQPDTPIDHRIGFFQKMFDAAQASPWLRVGDDWVDVCCAYMRDAQPAPTPPARVALSDEQKNTLFGRALMRPKTGPMIDVCWYAAGIEDAERHHGIAPAQGE